MGEAARSLSRPLARGWGPIRVDCVSENAAEESELGRVFRGCGRVELVLEVAGLLRPWIEAGAIEGVYLPKNCLGIVVCHQLSGCISTAGKG